MAHRAYPPHVEKHRLPWRDHRPLEPVNNFRYCEYQAATPSYPSLGPDWDALPIHSSHAAQATFSDHPVGQPIHLHVRPVGKA